MDRPPLRRLALVLALLLAVPADAAPKYVGSWLYGSGADAVKALRISVADDDGICWGSAVNTDYDPYLEVRRHNQESLFVTISGTWEDSTCCAALFLLGKVPVLVPTSGTSAYDAILMLKKCGGDQANIAADGEEQQFMFHIKRLP